MHSPYIGHPRVLKRDSGQLAMWEVLMLGQLEETLLPCSYKRCLDRMSEHTLRSSS